LTFLRYGDTVAADFKTIYTSTERIGVVQGCFGNWLKSMKNRHLAAVAIGGGTVALVGIFAPWATWERSWLGGYFSGDISAWELMLDSRPIIPYIMPFTGSH
jgi:hypothetical protein